MIIIIIIIKIFSCLNRADLIKVYDGGSSEYPVIRSLCNEISQVEILSTGPDLYIEFVANSEWPGQGFKANYHFQNLDGIHINGKYTDTIYTLTIMTSPIMTSSEKKYV